MKMIFKFLVLNELYDNIKFKNFFFKLKFIIIIFFFFFFGPQIPHGAPDDEAVRIFVAFTRLESAIKGVIC